MFSLYWRLAFLVTSLFVKQGRLWTEYQAAMLARMMLPKYEGIIVKHDIKNSALFPICSKGMEYLPYIHHKFKPNEAILGIILPSYVGIISYTMT